MNTSAYRNPARSKNTQAQVSTLSNLNNAEALMDLMTSGKAQLSNGEVNMDDVVKEFASNEFLVEAYLKRLLMGDFCAQTEMQSIALNMAIDMDARVSN